MDSIGNTYSSASIIFFLLLETWLCQHEDHAFVVADGSWSRPYLMTNMVAGWLLFTVNEAV